MTCEAAGGGLTESPSPEFSFGNGPTTRSFGLRGSITDEPDCDARDTFLALAVVAAGGGGGGGGIDDSAGRSKRRGVGSGVAGADLIHSPESPL